jgi:hypothetical protein
MRTIWIVFCIFSLAAAAAVWMFAAGWAGRVALLPDMELLSSGEWLVWLMGFAIMWGPVAAAVWFGWRAIKEKNSNAAD